LAMDEDTCAPIPEADSCSRRVSYKRKGVDTLYANVSCLSQLVLDLVQVDGGGQRVFELALGLLALRLRRAFSLCK